jgi:hypothetical protein
MAFLLPHGPPGIDDQVSASKVEKEIALIKSGRFDIAFD